MLKNRSEIDWPPIGQTDCQSSLFMSSSDIRRLLLQTSQTSRRTSLSSRSPETPPLRHQASLILSTSLPAYYAPPSSITSNSSGQRSPTHRLCIGSMCSLFVNSVEEEFQGNKGTLESGSGGFHVSLIVRFTHPGKVPLIFVQLSTLSPSFGPPCPTGGK